MDRMMPANNCFDCINKKVPVGTYLDCMTPADTCFDCINKKVPVGLDDTCSSLTDICAQMTAFFSGLSQHFPDSQAPSSYIKQTGR